MSSIACCHLFYKSLRRASSLSFFASASLNVMSWVWGVYLSTWPYNCACKMISRSAFMNSSWLSYFLVSSKSALISCCSRLSSRDNNLISSLVLLLIWCISFSFWSCCLFMLSRSNLYFVKSLRRAVILSSYWLSYFWRDSDLILSCSSICSMELISWSTFLSSS